MSRFVADVWAVVRITTSVGWSIECTSDKSQDLYRIAGLNTAKSGKMSMAQAMKKLNSKMGSDFAIVGVKIDSLDSIMRVHFSEPFDEYSFDWKEWKYLPLYERRKAMPFIAESLGDVLDVQLSRRDWFDLFEVLLEDVGVVLDPLDPRKGKAKPEEIVTIETIEKKITQEEPAQTPQAMDKAQDPMAMLTTALSMLQGGAQIDEAQIEAIVDRRLKAQKPLKVEVVSATATKRVDKAHKNFAKATQLLGLGKNVALIGESGSGKSFGAVQMAQALDKEYVIESCHGKMQSFDLVGAMSPTTGEYISSKLRDAYENGKVLILDEFDRSTTEVAIVLNGVLANDEFGFPDGMVTKHADFRVIACQNTFGNGTSKTYASAKPQDGSTLTRFTRVEWDIDEKLELAICGDTEATRVVQAIRKNAKSKGYDQILITPRQAIDCNEMVDTLGWSLKDAVQFSCLNALAPDVQKRLLDGVSL